MKVERPTDRSEPVQRRGLRITRAEPVRRPGLDGRPATGETSPYELAGEGSRRQPALARTSKPRRREPASAEQVWDGRRPDRDCLPRCDRMARPLVWATPSTSSCAADRDGQVFDRPTDAERYLEAEAPETRFASGDSTPDSTLTFARIWHRDTGAHPHWGCRWWSDVRESRQSTPAGCVGRPISIPARCPDTPRQAHHLRFIGLMPLRGRGDFEVRVTFDTPL